LLIGSIWKTWNGSAATDEVYCGWKCHHFELGFASNLPNFSQQQPKTWLL
jgi:hypothetical protein